MFLIPAIVALFSFVYLRPHEVFPVLQPVTLAWVLGLLLFAYLLDLRLGFTRPRYSVILALVTTLFGLCLVGIAVKSPETFNEKVSTLLASFLGFLFVSQGIQSLRALSACAGALLVITLILTVVGVEQGLAGKTCFLRTSESVTAAQAVEGRPCAGPETCAEGAPSGTEYWCEHPGLMQTRSIGGRVRYRGVLEDPNELAMAISMGVPFAFAFFDRRRSKLRLALVVATFVASFTCVIFTKSRSGQLSMLAMLGIYFIRGFGRRGAILAGIVAVPLLLLGGRSGEEAESSSEERLECWRAGFDMWRDNPAFGVGYGQFIEHHYLTAHNSVMLTLAELGPFGLLIWTAALFASFKILFRASQDFAHRPEAVEVRIWATALLASLTAMALSAFFLSVAYHPVIWITFGFVAAFYASVRKHDPSWKVRFGWREMAVVAAADIAIVAAMSLYLRLHGA